MPTEFDASEFVDSDLQAARQAAYSAAAAAGPAGEWQRPPSRQEVDAKVMETQQKLAELKHAQEDLERERAALEETRRRQMEFETGRHEMRQHLTRGVGLLEEAELKARRAAEQMAKAITGLRDALEKTQAIHEETWSQENYQVELTRALTTIENARMEWNAAQLKFPELSGVPAAARDDAPSAAGPVGTLLTTQNLAQLCKVGLALTWPLVLLALGIFLVLLLRR